MLTSLLQKCLPNFECLSLIACMQISEVEKPKDKQDEKLEAEKVAEKAPAKLRTMSEGADSDDDMDEVMLV